MTTRNVPLRVRVTNEEAARYKTAMKRLGLTEFSTYVRWALDNSTAQVLGTEVVKAASAPPAKPRTPRAPKPPPAPRVVPTPTQAPPQATLSAILGVPLFADTSRGPEPLVTTVDDGWV